MKKLKALLITIGSSIFIVVPALWYYVVFRGHSWENLLDAISIWIIAVGIVVPTTTYAMYRIKKVIK